MERSKEMQGFVDSLSKKITGRTLSDSQEKNICVFCGEEAKEFKDELSKAEYLISGMCQKCQDKTFG